MRRLLVPFAVAALSVAALPAGASAQSRCEAPRVLLTVDKSSSMLGELPSGTRKWDAATMALGELVGGFADTVDFGLQPFPVPDQCGAGEVVIDIGAHTREEILGGLGDPPPTGGNYTPMAQTLDAAAGYGPLADESRDAHLVLITDGWQWCDPYDPATRFDPVEAVEGLRDLGTTVHVIGFGGAVDSLTLNRAAVAAGTALPGCDETATEPSDPNHCYQQANDLSDLRAVLDDIGSFITDEDCDGYDNDCDEMVDEGYDTDGDGYTTCGTVDGEPGTTDPGEVDCDDSEPAVHPGAEEVCDGLDNDCDGTPDPGCGCSTGESRECGTDVGACTLGTQSCADGGWGECAGGITPAESDLCDGVDGDCDGTVDEDADCGPGEGCNDGMCIDLDEPSDEEGVEPPPEPTAPIKDGGCGCGVATPRGAAGGIVAAGLLLAGLLSRRRRRA